MIIESSAMVAILLGEPERKSFVELLASAGALRMSSVSLLETSIVLSSRRISAELPSKRTGGTAKEPDTRRS